MCSTTLAQLEIAGPLLVATLVETYETDNGPQEVETVYTLARKEEPAPTVVELEVLAGSAIASELVISGATEFIDNLAPAIVAPEVELRLEAYEAVPSE